jgi:vanillate O-demethylase monooxygenase subunit
MYPFREGSFAPRNAWYVAAFTREVGKQLLARTFLNEPVVLYRKENGEAVAVGGRCPHRHFPLGASCRKGDTIVCGYHGIAFGADDRCVSIPSQTHIPASYSIPTFPLVEHGMWLWIWMGDPDLADTGLLPDLKDIWYGEPGMEARPMYHHEVACRYQLLNDNLLDLSHLAFLHGTSIGNAADAETPERIVRRPGFISSRREMRDVAPPPITGAAGHAIDRIDRVSGMDFYLPGFHAGVGDSYHAQNDPERAGQPIRIARVYHAVTPSTHGSTYYWFGMSILNDADQLDFLEEYLKPVVAEDIFASEEIEKMLRLLGHSPKELMIKTDIGTVEGRRMLQAMMDAEAGDIALSDRPTIESL